jgi:uncharacterized protein (DUF2235 family)
MPASSLQQTFVIDRPADDGVQNIAFYERGVGTSGFLDNLRGGAFGVGLAGNIRRASMFLARNYRNRFEDEVYIFGFSRGSYTARSLTGLVGTIGLLTRAQTKMSRRFGSTIRTLAECRSFGPKLLHKYVVPMLLG